MIAAIAASCLGKPPQALWYPKSQTQSFHEAERGLSLCRISGPGRLTTWALCFEKVPSLRLPKLAVAAKVQNSFPGLRRSSPGPVGDVATLAGSHGSALLPWKPNGVPVDFRKRKAPLRPQDGTGRIAPLLQTPRQCIGRNTCQHDFAAYLRYMIR